MPWIDSAGNSPLWLFYVASASFGAMIVLIATLAPVPSYAIIIPVSAAIGACFKFTTFGFTCTFRDLVSKWNAGSFRMMLWFFAFATPIMSLVRKYAKFDAPATHDTSFGDAASPIGVSLAIGSFLFGMGMQLGSGCASGTLVGMGEGFLKSYVVLIFFIGGATFGAIDPVYKWWSGLPKTSAVSFYEKSGPLSGTIITVSMCIAVILITYIVDYFVFRNKKAQQLNIEDGFTQIQQLFSFGGDPSLNGAGASGKAFRHGLYKVLVFASLISIWYICSGGPIGVMGIFPIVGARVLEWFGAKPSTWKYFNEYSHIPHNLFHIEVVVSDISMILGSFIVTTYTRKFGAYQENGLGDMVKGIVGGFLMGIGGRMASGCNIGSMMSGITTNSLHGWVWMSCALLGSLTVSLIGNWYTKKHESHKDYDGF